MEVYLGYYDPPVNHPYVNYTPTDWAMYFVTRYGGIDGSHHKTWVLDQVARVLKGTPVIVSMRAWNAPHRCDDWEGEFVDRENGIVGEYDCSTADEPSEEYKEWVIESYGYDEETDTYEYTYDVGIPP